MAEMLRPELAKLIASGMTEDGTDGDAAEGRP
jgi:hypothetical protein